MNGSEERPRRRARKGEWLFGVTATLAIVGATILIGFLLPHTAVRAARLPVRELEGGARSVHINGFNLWYRETGSRKPDAPVIVVLHGGPGMSDHYFGNLLDAFGKDYRIVYYDQRGSGFSQIRRDASLYHFDYLVGDLEKLRRRAIHADKLILLGHSYGGLLAMRYAVDHPEHVGGLILVSSLPPKDFRTASAGEELDPLLPAEQPETADQQLLASYRHEVLSTLDNPSNGRIPEIGYMSYVPGRLLWRSSIGYDYTAELERLAPPALIIYGASDTFFESVPLSLHAALPGSTLVRFAHSGHWAFIEEPDRFLSVVGGFLERLQENSGAAG